MKIFNWVNRRFCHNFNSSTVSIHEDGFSRDSNQAKIKHQREYETQALLEDNDVLVDRLENWKLDGILTIGTLDIDPFESPNQQIEFNMEGDEEKKPYYTCDYDGGEAEYFAEQNRVLDLSSALEGGNIGLFKLYLHHQSEIEGVDAIDEEKGKETKNVGKRVTLAELFLADPDVEKKADVKPICAKKPAVFPAKKGLSKAKKLLPHAKEDLRPLKKLQEFMTRMMKTKIHPELGESKSQKRNNQLSKGNATNHEQRRATETVSLLHTQDVTV